MKNTNIQSKLVNETVSIDFDFSSMLSIGETLVSGAVTVDVFSGLDNSPSSILDGSESLSGATISQDITGGVAGVIYVLNCAATTSKGQELILQGKLAVVSSNPFV